MILLSRSEEIVLLAIWKLKNNAYGVTVREQVSRDTGHEWSVGWKILLSVFTSMCGHLCSLPLWLSCLH